MIREYENYKVTIRRVMYSISFQKQHQVIVGLADKCMEITRMLKAQTPKKLSNKCIKTNFVRESGFD